MFAGKIFKAFNLNDNRQFIFFVIVPLLMVLYSLVKYSINNPYIPMYASSIAEEGGGAGHRQS